MIGVFSIATVIALALQTTITRFLPFAVLMPNLVLVLAVNLGLRYYGAAAALMAFGIGYATDAFSGGLLGLNALLFSLVFILTYGMSRSLLSSTTAIGAACPTSSTCSTSCFSAMIPTTSPSASPIS